MNRINSIVNFLRFNGRNWKAVALCFFAATVFWFFNALNKTYTTNLRFPLKFDYDQQLYVPVRALPETVRLNVTGNGWALFRRSAGLKVPPLEIPLERPTETKRIVGTTLPAFFANQLDGLKINLVLADTLYVDLEPKTGKWSKLAIDPSSIRLRQGYGLSSDISILPDSVFLEGPRPLIEAIRDTLLLQIPFQNIAEPFMEDVEVRVPSSDLVRREPATVAVMFTVDKFETIVDSVSLVIKNIPSAAWPVIGRRKIPATFVGPSKFLDRAAIDSMKAVIDLRGIKRGEARFAPRIINVPSFIRVVKVDSVTVNF